VNEMATVAFQTLGCKVNHYETEAVWQLFKDAGYARVDFADHADVYVAKSSDGRFAKIRIVSSA